MRRVFLLCFLKITTFVACVPPDYCLQPLNTSNCDLEPVPVFSYYKPGSRCEIQTWMGCPTENKFADQFECTYICIKRTSAEDASHQLTNDLNDIDKLDGFETPQYCLEPLNTERCGTSFHLIYTYIPETDECQYTLWFNCKTKNKFRDASTCYGVCTGRQQTDTIEECDKDKLLEMLGKLTKEQLLEILQIVNPKIGVTSTNLPINEGTNQPESIIKSSTDNSNPLSKSPDIVDTTSNQNYESTNIDTGDLGPVVFIERQKNI